MACRATVVDEVGECMRMLVALLLGRGGGGRPTNGALVSRDRRLGPATMPLLCSSNSRAALRLGEMAMSLELVGQRSSKLSWVVIWVVSAVAA